MTHAICSVTIWALPKLISSTFLTHRRVCYHTSQILVCVLHHAANYFRKKHSMGANDNNLDSGKLSAFRFQNPAMGISRDGCRRWRQESIEAFLYYSITFTGGLF